MVVASLDMKDWYPLPASTRAGLPFFQGQEVTLSREVRHTEYPVSQESTMRGFLDSCLMPWTNTRTECGRVPNQIRPLSVVVIYPIQLRGRRLASGGEGACAAPSVTRRGAAAFRGRARRPRTYKKFQPTLQNPTTEWKASRRRGERRRVTCGERPRFATLERVRATEKKEGGSSRV
ncbi:hypothetical protein J6590_027744 [Homalodisca vitripennis]|nr:hypothetical protein J6590_027744 [Homalodisca vitripennis]